jgi:hypothetical protein
MMLANTKESFKISKDITHELSRTPLSLDGVFHHAFVIPPSRMFVLIVIGCATNAQ